jgi:DNA primase
MAIDTEAVRRSISMPELVGKHVELRKRGKKYIGLCPFHDEKTPSFHVYPNGYHCFGCGADGDCFSFVMHVDGVDFKEAARRLNASRIDGRELRRIVAERKRAKVEKIAKWKADHPWTWLRMQWEREQADKWLAEVEYLKARISAVP